MSNGDPELRVVDAPAAAAEPSDEDFDARITLRLPPSLKRIIEDSATIDGESVNAWVVDALNKRAKRNDPKGKRVTDAFDL
jgi:predicted HicB family RNase H-like nuclease